MTTRITEDTAGAAANKEAQGRTMREPGPELGAQPAYSTDSLPFWEWLVAVGLIEGDAAYYADGKAQPEEYGNAITVALQASAPGSPERAEFVDRMYEEGIITSADTPEGRAYWTDTDAEAFGADIDNLAQAAETKYVGSAEAASGGPEGMMSGGTLTKFTRPGEDPIWAMTFTYGEVSHVYTFDSFEQMEKQLGSGAVASGNWGYQEMPYDRLDDPDSNVWLFGSAASLAGASGRSYQTWFEGIMRTAALESGVRQPGLLGEYMRNPEVQRILAMAEAGDWSDTRQLAELRASDYYRNELYPGIDSIMAHNATDPEGEWLRYMNSVTPYLGQLGYEKGDDGSYRHLMGEMLDKGIRADEFATFTPTFIRAEQSPEYASVLDQWVQAETGGELDFESWFDVLAGTSDAELDAIVEKAGIQFQMDQTNIELDAGQISRLAELTEFSEQQIALAFTGAESQLIGLGDDGLSRYGLSEIELVNAKFGVDTEGGRSAAEVSRLAGKTLNELGLQDDRKAQFYTTFDQRKRPVREGLAAAAPEYG